VGDARTGVGLSDRIAACTQQLKRNTKALAATGHQIAAILQDLKSNAKAIAAAGPPFLACRVHGGSATNGFDDGGLANLSVGDADADAKTGARELDEIDDPSPGPSVGGCVGTDPLPEAKKAQLLHSSSIACFVPGSSTAPPALMPSMTAGSPSCPHRGISVIISTTGLLCSCSISWGLRTLFGWSNLLTHELMSASPMLLTFFYPTSSVRCNGSQKIFKSIKG
jgi:hypothetical protein